MPELTVDGRRVRVPEGATLLDAARALGRPVPTLCCGPDLPHHTSCLVCLVEELGSGRLVPACATPASDGLEVRTDGPRVLAARRKSVELLLSEHAGDCEAPCVRACPAHADIPGMIRRLQRGDIAGAWRVLWERLPLAGALAHVCPAPCEHTCRRALLDAPVGIRGLKKAVVEAGNGAEAGAVAPPASGRRVAVVGAGPAGLAAAWFLARAGHRCRLFDEHPEAGGALRYDIGPDRLPRPVLAADLDVLRRQGVEFVLGQAVRGGPAFEELRSAHDAVVLAVGSPARLAGVLPAGTSFDPDTGACALPGVFAGGNAVARQPSRLAVRAVEAGRRLAWAAGLFLEGRPFAPERPRFDSRLGPEAARQQARCAEALRPASAAAATAAPAGGPAGAEEAARCLGCDCARQASCGLRALADELGADPRAFPGEERRPFERRRGGQGGARGLSFEPGKCIKCGLCVRIAERGGDRPGLAFTGRGFDLGLRVPFNEDIDAALAGTAAECAARCPTGALIWNRR